MATTHTVVYGDSLWGIAQKYLGDGTKYTYLAKINNISSPYYIYVGQIIKLSGGASTTTTAKNNSNKAIVDRFGFQSNSDNTLFATWKWDKSNTDKYQVRWTYATGDGVGFVGSDSTVDIKQSTYSPPANAKKVSFFVKPISKTYTKNNKETSYWTAEWSTVKEYWVKDNPPTKPDPPEVDIDDYKLTAKLTNLDVNAEGIQFQVVKDNTSVFKTGKATIKYSDVSFSCNVAAGGKYKVRCRSYRGNKYSDWSDYSDEKETIPSVSSGLTVCRASSETSVYLEWKKVNTATSYDIEYTTKKEYFDGSNQTTSESGIEFTHFELTGLESGKEYFFRIRAVNEKGPSAWSGVKSVVIGKPPVAPTTWSSTTTAVIGEPLTLYWVHNAEDESSQTYAELRLYVNGVQQLPDITIKNSTDEDEKDRTSAYVIDTSKFENATKIQWCVRTAGVTKEYGEWSVQRTIDVYPAPSLDLRVLDFDGDPIEVIESFPFRIYGLPGEGQIPIGYHLSIVSNEIYETVDSVGNFKMVNKGEAVYSKYFDISDELFVEMSAGNIDLENNVSYTVKCTVTMNSGLTTEETTDITVSWTDLEYEPSAEIGIDKESLTASIRPYCEYFPTTNYRVSSTPTTSTVSDPHIVDYDPVTNTYTVNREVVVITDSVPTEHSTVTGEHVLIGHLVDGTEILYCIVEYEIEAYEVTSDIVDVTDGVVIEDASTTDGLEVLKGTTLDGTEVYYCTVQSEEPVLVENVTLSVYRREFDGTFTELASGIQNVSNTFITDPHPALDYARYRIVATDVATGAISYSDIPGYPVGEISAIIQWDEEWSNFDTDNDDVLEQPSWSGSLLKLKYNIDVSDSNDVDVSLVEYAGRKHPVTYYGTQLGSSSTWNVEIPKDDVETLYAIRRLAIWAGDVYVREPSGSGYWATISVSYSQKHCELTIPISLNITRVEGGI